MGIKDLFKIKKLGDQYKELTFDDVNKGKVGVDALIVLFAALTGTPTILKSKGKITVHINTIVNKLIKLTSKQIWVFDNIVRNEDKVERKAIYSRYPVFEHISLKEAIADLKDILTMCKVPFIDAPPCIEAEAYLCEMKKNNIIDYILSRDTDVLAYGCDLLIYNKGKFQYYEVQKVLDHLKLDMLKFRKLCCMLQNDFNKKTYGISSEKMLNNLDIGLTPKQQVTYVLFSSRVMLKYKDNIQMFSVLSSPCTKNNKDLIKYLENLSFKRLIQRL